MQIDAPNGADPAIEDPTKAHIKAEAVHLTVQTEATPAAPQIETRYTLADANAFVLVETTWHNQTDKPIKISPVDELRADQSFERVEDGETTMYWVYDKWWDQAYGIVADGAQIDAGVALDKRTLAARYVVDDEKSVEIEPGSQFRLIRRVFRAGIMLSFARWLSTWLTTRSLRRRWKSKTRKVIRLWPLMSNCSSMVTTTPRPGRALMASWSCICRGRRSLHGQDHVAPHGEKSVELKPGLTTAELPAPGYVVAKITAENGGKIPCKVELKPWTAARSVLQSSERRAYGPQFVLLA